MNLFQLLKESRKIFRLSWNEKTLLLEALILTGIIRFAILFIPFNKLATHIGKHKEESSKEVNDFEKIIVNRIGWAVSVVSTRTPWESKCLVKALTAQIMLTKRKVSSTVYLGVRKDEGYKLIAHAWLRSGIDIITGGEVSSSFTQVAKFANNVRRKKL